MSDPPVPIRKSQGSQRIAEFLTKRFYAWEKRTRGYLVFPYPVSPEPPFAPFAGHYLPPQSFPDDTRKPTILSSFAEKIRSVFIGNTEEVKKPPDFFENDFDFLPELYVPDGEIIEYQIALPRDFECPKLLVDQFLKSLNYVRFPISFEVIGTKNQVLIQFACREYDSQQVFSQLGAYLPQAAISQEKNYLLSLWDSEAYSGIGLFDFGLDQECMLPLNRVQRFDVDPLIGVVGALSNCQGQDIGILQVLFLPVRNPWADSLTRSVVDCEGKPFFADAPELARSVKDKIDKPLSGVVIRAGARSDSIARANSIVKFIGGALTQFNSPSCNSLIPLNNDGYPDEIHLQDLLDRHTHRSGMLLNLDELVNFVHFPCASIRSEKLLRVIKKTKSAPSISEGHSLLLGYNEHRGETTAVTLSVEQRMRHMYAIGASGTGKSTLLANLIIQGIRNDEGLAVLDPHGDLIDQILDFIPYQRIQDVVLFDPADEEYPVGLNIFSAHSETEKTLLASDLTGVFRRLSSSWGDQMNSILANGILAMLESGQGGTLMTLRRFLIEKEFRREFLKTVRDPEIVYYWEKEYPLLSGKPQAPVLTRLDTFLRPKHIRHIVAQKENKIDFGQIMNEGKIFLAKLSHGGIGEENSYLLGALIVAKFHQMAMSRQEIAREKRRPFYLYIDEFQNFITPSMESILSGARKYNLGLVLAHQELRQLASKDREVASSVIANPYTRICFRMGDYDAGKLASGLSYFNAQDLQSLGIGQAIVRIEQAEYDFNLQTAQLPEKTNTDSKLLREEIINQSRAKYATSKEEVEKELEESRISFAVERKAPADKAMENHAKRVLEGESECQESDQIANSVVEKKHFQASQDFPLVGRGGVQHKYLQQLIKRLAEERGYRSDVEQTVLGGAGIVDVSLEKAGEKIACEISVTTPPSHELENIQKCLAAGYDSVFVLSHEKGRLNKIRQLAGETFDESSQGRVNFFQPEEFIEFLDQKNVQIHSGEKTVRGYKVKVNYKTVDAAEQKQKRDAISRLIVQSMKRMKE